MITKILLSFAALVALSLASCNTVSGMGEDIQDTGKAIEHAASS